MQTIDGSHPSQPILNLSGRWSIHWPLSPRTRNADDETLLQLIAEGSEADSQMALETIFVRHHKDVWRYVRSRVSTAADTDEIAAAVWVVVLEKIHTFVWTGTPIKAWLLSIAHRKTQEFFRKPCTLSIEGLGEEQDEALYFIAGQLQFIEIEEQEPATEIHPQVRKEADELLHQMIARLSDVERQIIMLLYFESLENATEVADRLGMNKNTIRVYHKRARDKLRASPELSSLFDERPDES